MTEEKSVGQREPRRRANIVLIIELGLAEQRPRRPDESVLVRIVDLPFLVVIENNSLFPPIGRSPIKVRADQPSLSQEIVERFWIEDRVRVSGVAQ